MFQNLFLICSTIRLIWRCSQIVKQVQRSWNSNNWLPPGTSSQHPRVPLEPGVNFINILRARFLYKSELSSFSLDTFGFVIFWRKNIGAKCVRKTLMKLTPKYTYRIHAKCSKQIIFTYPEYVGVVPCMVSFVTGYQCTLAVPGKMF